MLSNLESIATSVNTRCVAKWDKQDVLTWIKIHQDREAFEGKNTVQFNVMNSIINKKRLSGKHLEKCNTIISIGRLFENKIRDVTARVLLDSLNIERAMYEKRKLSKSIINKSDW
eukprot:232349_1